MNNNNTSSSCFGARLLVVLALVIVNTECYTHMEDCSMDYCTSPDTEEGEDCWAGSEHEPCSCSGGRTAYETGLTTEFEGRTYYEYTCCYEDTMTEPGQGDICGDYNPVGAIVGFLFFAATIGLFCCCWCYCAQKQRGQAAARASVAVTAAPAKTIQLTATAPVAPAANMPMAQLATATPMPMAQPLGQLGQPVTFGQMQPQLGQPQLWDMPQNGQMQPQSGNAMPQFGMTQQQPQFGDMPQYGMQMTQMQQQPIFA
eukprot:CAMPEP_0118638924 /NCGR_PEP_ID=MMETSP0785-20121206/3955_1 /TAXON_ID=91992 /ORGANISM="Bolidomonas pacifica, Strain CCMP 1866" /LENGTH=256 /DNA_ID=CAMNT_0006530229 /DNA_START=35 /DNA_END=802 /DNA_ORIENTATION=-